MGSALFVEQEQEIMQYCDYADRIMISGVSRKYHVLIMGHLDVLYRGEPAAYYPTVDILRYNRLVNDKVAMIIATQYRVYGMEILPRVIVPDTIPWTCMDLSLRAFELCISSILVSELPIATQPMVEDILFCWSWTSALVSTERHGIPAVMHSLYLGFIRVYPAGLHDVLYDLYRSFATKSVAKYLHHMSAKHSRGELRSNEGVILPPIKYDQQQLYGIFGAGDV